MYSTAGKLKSEFIKSFSYRRQNVILFVHRMFVTLLFQNLHTQNVTALSSVNDTGNSSKVHLNPDPPCMLTVYCGYNSVILKVHSVMILTLLCWFILCRHL